MKRAERRLNQTFFTIVGLWLTMTIGLIGYAVTHSNQNTPSTIAATRR